MIEKISENANFPENFGSFARDYRKIKVEKINQFTIISRDFPQIWSNI